MNAIIHFRLQKFAFHSSYEKKNNIETVNSRDKRSKKKTEKKTIIHPFCFVYISICFPLINLVYRVTFKEEEL